MPRLLRRNLRCHYCNATSRNTHPGGFPQRWQCSSCGSENYLDERGNITDPPIEATSMDSSRLQYARSPSPSPYPSSTESPFCATCQHNQFLLSTTLAEYIPDEDDPQYAKYLASADAYRAELEERYPQVCENCIGRVQDRIRAAGYAAKADNLKRRLVESRKYQSKESTVRQTFTLAAISVGQWAYLLSVSAGLLWHVMGTMAFPEDQPLTFSWKTCAKQTVFLRGVPESCLNSPEILEFLRYALLADFFTFWWNPKLRQKTTRPGCRMHNLTFVWFVRVAAFALRYAGYTMLRNVEEDTREGFHYTHGAFLALLLFTSLIACNSVRISHQSTKSLLQPLDAHLPSITRSAEKPRPKTPRTNTRPVTTTFDTMAQSFTSSFNVEPNSAYPPSPTLTAESSATEEDSDWAATPFNQHQKALRDSANDMAMDWTPTRKRFTTNAPPVLSPVFHPSSPPFQNQQPRASPAAPSPTPRRQPQHSLFTSQNQDPNPFRHRVPAPPPRSLAANKAAASSSSARFGTPATAPPSQSNHFLRSHNQGGRNTNKLFNGPGADALDPDWNVPRNVRREDELFSSPKFKYDGYALGKGVRDTGLEKGFNDLFSK